MGSPSGTFIKAMLNLIVNCEGLSLAKVMEPSRDTLSNVSSGVVPEKVKPSAYVTVPDGVLMTISTMPDVCAGLTTLIFVAETMVNEATFVPPKVTAVAPVKSVPVPSLMVTVVPPDIRPKLGFMFAEK